MKATVALRRLKYSSRMDSKFYAELVDETSKKVPILYHRPDQPVPEDTHNGHNSTPTTRTRLSEKSAENQSHGNQLVIFPRELADVVSHHTWNVAPKKLRDQAAKYYQSLANQEPHKPSENLLEVDMHMTGVMLQNYASLYNVLGELKRRLTHTPGWKPKRILDIGYGPATGMLVANEIFKHELTEAEPDLKVATVIGHDGMLKRAQALLKAQGDEQTKVVRNVPTNAGTVGLFDLVIVTHQMSRDIEANTDRLVSLLAPKGVLVVVERGDPFGFELVARTRQILVRPENEIEEKGQEVKETKEPRNSHRSPMKILAPCTHQGKCPLQVGFDVRAQGKNAGFFNWCHHGQMIQRPKFAQELKKGASLAQRWIEPGKGSGGKVLAGNGRPLGKSYETATHSYLIVQKDSSSEGSSVAPQNSARIMRAPMKRDKHVTMEVCSHTAQIEHWTVTKSYDSQAYYDARKASGGDLWTQGAKSVQVRGGNTAKLERLSTKIQNSKPLMVGTKFGRVQSRLEERAWERKIQKQRKKLDAEMDIEEFVESELERRQGP